MIVAFGLKLTPHHWVEKLPIKVDENEVLGRDSILMKTYENQAKGGIPDFRKKGKQSSLNDSQMSEDETAPMTKGGGGGAAHDSDDDYIQA